MIEKETMTQTQVLGSDGGGEYFSYEFNDYLKDQGIQRNADLPLSRMGLHKEITSTLKKSQGLC